MHITDRQSEAMEKTAAEQRGNIERVRRAHSISPRSNGQWPIEK